MTNLSLALAYGVFAVLFLTLAGRSAAFVVARDVAHGIVFVLLIVWFIGLLYAICVSHGWIDH